MSKHTPGPWQLKVGESVRRPILIKGSTGAIVAEVYWDQLFMDEDAETAANARLMLAAPDLLAACKRMMQWLAEPPPPSEYDEKADTARKIEVISLAQDAIFKAEAQS